MTWILVILSIVGTDVSAQTLSTHASMSDCFEARRNLAWAGMQGPELLCVREKGPQNASAKQRD